MSRTLARLRSATGDPLLVQAGRSLVPTPYAEQLVERVHVLARDARAVLTPTVGSLDLASLDRTFTIRANEGFVTLFAAAIVTAIAREAPLVRLRFAPKPDKDATPLREGTIDVEVGTQGVSAPEVRTLRLFRDRFIGVARLGHPLLDGAMTPRRYAACGHVVASRRGALTGPVDNALQELGLERKVIAVVPGFLDALTIARQSDLIALVPRSCLRKWGSGGARPGRLRPSRVHARTDNQRDVAPPPQCRPGPPMVSAETRRDLSGDALTRARRRLRFQHGHGHHRPERRKPFELTGEGVSNAMFVLKPTLLSDRTAR